MMVQAMATSEETEGAEREVQKELRKRIFEEATGRVAATKSATNSAFTKEVVVCPKAPIDVQPREI